MKRFFFSVLVVFWCVLAGWLGGVDFSIRGTGSFFVYLYSSLAFGLTYSYPGWKE